MNRLLIYQPPPLYKGQRNKPYPGIHKEKNARFFPGIHKEGRRRGKIDVHEEQNLKNKRRSKSNVYEHFSTNNLFIFYMKPRNPFIFLENRYIKKSLITIANSLI